MQKIEPSSSKGGVLGSRVAENTQHPLKVFGFDDVGSRVYYGPLGRVFGLNMVQRKWVFDLGLVGPRTPKHKPKNLICF